jgi:hypothetical protein
MFKKMIQVLDILLSLFTLARRRGFHDSGLTIISVRRLSVNRSSGLAWTIPQLCGLMIDDDDDDCGGLALREAGTHACTGSNIIELDTSLGRI